MTDTLASRQETIHDRLRSRLAEILGRRTAAAYSESSPFRQLVRELESTLMAGKKLRSTLLLDAYTALGGAELETAVDVSCAFEFLHTAFLIHDDIIDHDRLRRGRPTVAAAFEADAEAQGVREGHAKDWGLTAALLCGDLALSTAHSLVAGVDVPAAARLRIVEIFDQAVWATAEGELMDVRFGASGRSEGPRQIVDMMEKKTARYSIEAPLTAAAVLASASRDQERELARVGRKIGVAFQLRDDVLGVFGSSAVTGKSTLSDLRQGKQTLLVEYAQRDRRWRDVAEAFGTPEMTEAQAEQIRAVMRRTGALERVERMIASLVGETRMALVQSTLPRSVCELLETVLVECSERCA